MMSEIVYIDPEIEKQVDDGIKAMRNGGQMHKDIAKQLHISKSEVDRRVRRMLRWGEIGPTPRNLKGDWLK